MAKKYLQYAISIVIIALAVALVCGIVSLIYSVLKPASFLFKFADVLFLVGGAILTVGAIIEFFLRARSPAIARSLLTPYEALQKLSAFEEIDREKAQKGEDQGSGGWMLIFIGALCVAISFIIALIQVK